MLTQRPTPAKMSKEAAQKLPRYALLLLFAVFMLGGLWIDGLWTQRDAEAFGVAYQTSAGTLKDWLLPSAAGLASVHAGPLTAWVSAFFIRLFGGLSGDVLSYRLAALLWFAISTAALWYGTAALARRQEAQPVAFAFGGEAAPRDYSRCIADCAVLLFVATFGIVTRQHEAIADTALLSFSCLTFYGLVKTLKRPYVGAALTGAAIGGAVLASTLFAGVWLLAAAIIVNAAIHAFPASRNLRLAITTLLAVGIPALWTAAAFAAVPEAAQTWFAAWIAAQAANFGTTSFSTILWVLENFIWYLCPMWPLFVWGLYSWRRQLDRTALFLPLVVSAATALAAFFSSSQAADSVFFNCIPSMCVFSAFALPTLRRTRKDLLDWFSVSVFSLAVLTLWSYWLAWLTSFAPKMAHSIEMLAPGAEASIDGSTAAAAAASVVWFAFCAWRMTHRPDLAWRGPWLAAAGMTAVSTVLLGLFHTAIDANRSYAPVAVELAQTLKTAGLDADECVQANALPAGIRAALAYYGSIRFAPDGKGLESRPQRCRFAVVRNRSGLLADNMIGIPASRPHTDEIFFVIPNRAASAAAAELP